MTYNLNIVHMYPESMNIYGDLGNIITLQKRCEWRNINTNLIKINKQTRLEDLEKIKGDIYFLGGGQDNDMYAVFEDLYKNKKDFISKEVNNNKVFLLICGGFQLFGKYFLDSKNRTIKGLDIVPSVTKAPSDTLRDRCLGNLITKVHGNLKEEIQQIYQSEMPDTFVGFENHSGQTFFEDNNLVPMGNVLYGKGNNSTQKIEGVRYKNIFGSYTHGSLLPKNPHLADFLISLALQNKYKTNISLEKMDDFIELNAHKTILDKYLK